MPDPRTEPVSEAPTLTGVRAGAFTLYKVLIALFTVAVLVQIFLAGLGIFDSQRPATASAELEPHRTLGTILTQPAAVVLLVVVLVARPAQRIVPKTAALVVLGGIQTYLGSAGAGTPVLGALHTVVAIGYLGLAVDLTRTALDRRSG